MVPSLSWYSRRACSYLYRFSHPEALSTFGKPGVTAEGLTSYECPVHSKLLEGESLGFVVVAMMLPNDVFGTQGEGHVVGGALSWPVA